MRRALAMGADRAAMASVPAFGGSAAWNTTYALAAEIREIGFDLVVAINNDGDAAIASFAGLLGVGDSFTIVPELFTAPRAAQAVHAEARHPSGTRRARRRAEHFTNERRQLGRSRKVRKVT